MAIRSAPARLAEVARWLSFAICLMPLAALATPTEAAGDAASQVRRPIEIRFDSLSPTHGLRLSVRTRGDGDGLTTFANTACCGIKTAQQFIHDVRAYTGDQPLPVARSAKGWTVRHAPGAALRVSYRLPPSGPMKIDVGVPEQLRPIVDANSFHLIGTFGLLLPAGRQSELVALRIDASRVAANANFACSFGMGNRISGVHVTLREVVKGIYVGGSIAVSIHQTPGGKVAIAYGGMKPGFQAAEFSKDALAILAAERKFFNRSQPWFLVSLRGGVPKNPVINLGGGTGLTNAFAMFSRSDLDARSLEHREQLRLVLAHEYFHSWNGQVLRVARKPGSRGDDASVYWFSEGVTEFYALRTLTRFGLMSPERALAHFDSKLRRYAANRRRGASAKQAGELFWTDPDAEQIPYLRGYLAAWVAEIALQRGSSGARGLDEAMRALVARGQAERDFRIDNSFLTSYLTAGMSARDARNFRDFVLEGGDAPLGVDSFAPCLRGQRKDIAGTKTLQFGFAQPTRSNCFRH